MEIQPIRHFSASPVWLVALLLASVSGMLGCASLSQSFGQIFGRAVVQEPLPAIVEPRVFLGGEALAQKKARMRRVHADLVHLHRGYTVVARQQKHEDQKQLEAFVRPFIERHVAPLVASDSEAWNTDLRLLEANLLFAEAALLVAIDDRAGLTEVIATLSDRFGGHESLLIEYPIGETQTLAHGIRDLRSAQAWL